MGASLLPNVKAKFWDRNGNPLVGGKVYTYEAGSVSTLKTTWKDADKVSANTNPVILDAYGEADIWLDGNYKINLTDSAGVNQWATPIDDVSALNNLSSIYTTTGGANAYILTPSPAITTYTGASFTFIASFTNSSTATLNVSGLGAISIRKQGTVALESGDIVNGNIYYVAYDGTYFELVNSNLPRSITFDKVLVTNSSSDNAFEVRQTGTGNVAVFEDSGNPDATPIVFDPNGRVIVGYTTNIAVGGANPNIQLHGTTAGTTSMTTSRWSADANGSNIVLSKSRSTTVGSFAAVQSGDVIGTISWASDDGVDLNAISGSIEVVASALATANNTPANMVFSINAGANSSTEFMRAYANRGVVLDSATGASQGAGTLNAKGVYKNGVEIAPVTSFVSTNITVATGDQAYTAQAHGLSSTPRKFGAYIQCTSADQNYAVGDRVRFPFNHWTGATNIKADVVANATNLQIIQSNGIYVSNKTTMAMAAIDYTKWVAVMWAEV